MEQEIKNEIDSLRKEVAELKVLLLAIQKQLNTTLMHTQGLYGKIDDIKK